MKTSILKLIAAALCLAWALGGRAVELLPTDDRVMIENFQIKPGDSRLVDVLMESSVPWTTLEAHVLLPEGLELVAPDKGEIDPEQYYYDTGDIIGLSRNFWDKSLVSGPEADKFKENKKNYVLAYDSSPKSSSETFGIFIWAQLPGYLIMGNGTYNLVQIKLKAAETFAGGEIVIHGVKFASYSNGEHYESGSSYSEVECSGQPYRAMVTLPPTAISEVKAAQSDAAESRIFDLQGRPVTGQPAPGIYIQDGKKVLVK